MASRCNDVVVILPTGGGKTIVPLISSLLHSLSVTVFVLPFNSLIFDYQRRLDKYDIKYVVFTSQTRCISGKERIVLVSVEIARSDHFAQCVQEAHTRVSIPAIVLDEVQTVSTAQHYRASLRQIFTLRSIPAQFILLSGTIPPISLDLILHEFHIHQEAVILRAPTNRPELSYIIHPPISSESDLIEEVVSLFKSGTKGFSESQRALIYVPYIALGIQLAHRLSCDFYNGHETTSAQERRQMYDTWINGTNNVMVATHAFGAGNDYDQVSLIIHAGTPFEMINYIQEVGRAGRDGLPAKCHLLPRPRAEPVEPLHSIDHTGVVAMYHMIFTSDLCIRFLITMFTDGEGVLCSQLSENQLCSRCLPVTSAYPTSLPSGKRKSPPSDHSHPQSSLSLDLPLPPSSGFRPPSRPTPTQPNTPKSSLAASSPIPVHTATVSSQRPPTPSSHSNNSFSSSSSNGFRPSPSLSIISQALPSSFPSPSHLPSASPIASFSSTAQRPLSRSSNVFEVQADSSKRRRIEELAQNSDYATQIKDAFVQIGNDCTCCLVLDQPPQFHLANDCPSLPDGFASMRVWRSTIKFLHRVHGSTCWVCHFPVSVPGSSHPPVSSSPATCPYQDRIPPLLWTLFFHPEKRSALEAFFAIQLPTPQAFSIWLSAQPIPGHRNNSMAVFLWFIENYVSPRTKISQTSH